MIAFEIISATPLNVRGVEPVDPAAINEQIDRILQSQTFATKVQLRKLLEILHKNMASQSALTTELVIKQLWPTETKTKHAKDVATEMNRLRRAVEFYYSGEGKADRVIIHFPKRAPGGDGHQETRWMDAMPRDGMDAPPPVQPASLATAHATPDKPTSTPTGEITCSGRSTRE